MIFWRFLCNHWTYLLLDNSGRSRFEFGTSDHFLDTLQPVVGEIFGKVWNGNTQICCSITAHSWEGTVQSWYTCLHYFGKALQYCDVVLQHAESLPTDKCKLNQVQRSRDCHLSQLEWQVFRGKSPNAVASGTDLPSTRARNTSSRTDWCNLWD